MIVEGIVYSLPYWELKIWRKPGYKGTSSGSQVVCQINTNVAALGSSFGAPVMTAVMRFTRVLEIRGGATRVIG